MYRESTIKSYKSLSMLFFFYYHYCLIKVMAWNKLFYDVIVDNLTPYMYKMYIESVSLLL